MWPDNETDIDLLGFEFLVEELEVLLTEQRLLPVTVGVSGDWGSGKSSLMEMARARLESDQNEKHFICVSFSPWRFENFGYGKAALMAAVIDAIADRGADIQGALEEVVDKAKKLRERLTRFGVIKGGTAIAATALGASPPEAALAGQAAEALGGMATAPHAEPAREFESVASFHVDFEELVQALGEEFRAVVVFVDDMDRCSTETIVETFEAMRLFLHAPKTAYVVGANYQIVEAALDGRYPARREGDDDLGHNYLEKMLQNTVAVPPLSEPEVLTYINLLFCELRTSAEDFATLRNLTSANRAKNQLSVALNAGIAESAMGELSPDLTTDLDIATVIGPSLSRGLRGNPRQIKRFLNRFLLRLRTAGKREMVLDPATLAKLMVLEELHPGDFSKLFVWHLQTEAGVPTEVRLAEELVAGKEPDDPPADVSDWIVQPGIADWLKLSPSLAGVPLGPYFTFSREKLAGSIETARLSLEIQVLLGELESSVRPKQEKAISTASELDAAGLSELLPALLDAAVLDTDGEAAKALVALARRRTEVALAMFEKLVLLPVPKVKGNFVLLLGTAFKGDVRLEQLLPVWLEKGSASVKRQAGRVLGQA
jgi:hypothetical protein